MPAPLRSQGGSTLSGSLLALTAIAGLAAGGAILFRAAAARLERIEAAVPEMAATLAAQAADLLRAAEEPPFPASPAGPPPPLVHVGVPPPFPGGFWLPPGRTPFCPRPLPRFQGPGWGLKPHASATAAQKAWSSPRA